MRARLSGPGSEVTVLVCPICRCVLAEDGNCSDHFVGTIEVADHPIPPELAQRFDVTTVYGGGDSGALYRAVDGKTGAEGLLKIMSLSPASSDAGRDRLRRHIERQRAVSGPETLTRLRAAAVGEDVAWLFRDWVEGESLKSRLFREREFGVAEAAAITMQVAEALDALHTAGLVHRAVRPGHVLLRGGSAGMAPEAVLIDAGIAGETELGSAFDDLGDLLYMSPEQTKGRAVSFRSDLYSLGCLLFDALTGDPPFDGEDVAAVCAAHQHQMPEIPRDRLPSKVADLLAKLLAKHPSDRPMSTREVLTELKPYAADIDRSARPAPQPSRRMSSRPPVLRDLPSGADPVPLVRKRGNSSAPPPAVSLRSIPSSTPRPAAALRAIPASSPPPAVALKAVPTSSPPAPEPAVVVDLDAVREKSVEPAPANSGSSAASGTEGAESPAPAPASRKSSVPPPAAPLSSFASRPVRTRRDPSSIRIALADIRPAVHEDEPDPEEIVFGKKKKPPRRLTWLLVGFVLGVAGSAGALYGLAMNGQFERVPDAMTTYLAVPPRLVEVEPLPVAVPEEPVEPEPIVEEAGEPEAAAADEGDESAAGEGAEEGAADEGAGEDAEADGEATDEDGADEANASDAEAETEAAEEEEVELTPAERRAQRREARRERIRQRYLRQRRAERAAGRSSDDEPTATGSEPAPSPMAAPRSSDDDFLDSLSL